VTKVESHARRLDAYKAVRRRHAAGMPLLTISRELGLSPGPVRRYASAPSFPESAAPVPGARAIGSVPGARAATAPCPAAWGPGRCSRRGCSEAQ
jgi:hypothetical protein